MTKTTLLVFTLGLFGACLSVLGAETGSTDPVPPAIPAELTPSPTAKSELVLVPPPNPLPTLQRPPLRPVVQPLARPDFAEMQRLTPRIEMWRSQATRPQVPASHGRATDHVFITGNDLATFRLQFKPTAAGERVLVTAANGFSLNPPQQVLTVSDRGECFVTGQLAEGASRGDIVLRCKMITIRVPIVRARLAVVEKAEALTGGRP